MKSVVKFCCSCGHWALALLCLGLILVPESWADLMSYKRDAVIAGEWWRLWSGHFVHFTSMHALVNGLLLLLLSAMIAGFYSWGLVASLFLVGPFAISLALIGFVPEMTVYRGASALAALFMAICLGRALWNARGMRALFPYALIVAWLAKLFAEVVGGTGFSNLPPGVHVAWQVHVAGILVGVSVLFVMHRKTGIIRGQ